MNKRLPAWSVLLTALLVLGALLWVHSLARAQAPGATLAGQVLDQQGQPITGARVLLLGSFSDDAPITEASTQPDGTFTLHPRLSAPPSRPLSLRIERAHFQPIQVPLTATQSQALLQGKAVAMPPITLERRFGLAFWVATLLFIAMLLLIASSEIHNTLATLATASLALAISYLGKPVTPDLFIFDFERALEYVDWNVIFLILGMMIVIAVVERTGIFQWMAYRAYRVSGGRLWLLLPILMLITGVASAFLDNVTTMLLMTPITIQIALAMGANPLALLLPEVFASNVVGISTLIGTPTNILIGSFAGISFNDFLQNLTPGVLLAFLGLIGYSEWVYRSDLRNATQSSPLLLAKLSERARITDTDHLRKAGWIGLAMLLLFVFGERIHLVPAVTALMGAAALLVWIRPNIEEMIEAVDWTTLVFFITLFIVIGAIREVGLIAWLATRIGALVGTHLTLAVIVVLWSSALLSTVIPNIPFTAAMLPVVGYLTQTIPGAETLVLFYCLSVGSAMGGNGSLIGASANLVTAGIAERAGYPITYQDFLKRGFPALLITVGLAMIWMLIRF